MSKAAFFCTLVLVSSISQSGFATQVEQLKTADLIVVAELNGSHKVRILEIYSGTVDEKEGISLANECFADDTFGGGDSLYKRAGHYLLFLRKSKDGTYALATTFESYFRVPATRPLTKARSVLDAVSNEVRQCWKSDDAELVRGGLIWAAHLQLNDEVSDYVNSQIQEKRTMPEVLLAWSLADRVRGGKPDDIRAAIDFMDSHPSESIVIANAFSAIGGTTDVGLLNRLLTDRRLTRSLVISSERWADVSTVVPLTEALLGLDADAKYQGIVAIARILKQTPPSHREFFSRLGERGLLQRTNEERSSSDRNK